jgi:hypothetical protein
MVQTLRFTFLADPSLYPPSSIMYRKDKVYFAVVVFEIDGNDFKEVISTTVVGILPSQEIRYRYQGHHRLNPGDLPWLKDVIMKHFEREEQRLLVVVEKQKPWPQLHNGAGSRTSDEEPRKPLRPFLVQ